MLLISVERLVEARLDRVVWAKMVVLIMVVPVAVAVELEAEVLRRDMMVLVGL